MILDLKNQVKLKNFAILLGYSVTLLSLAVLVGIYYNITALTSVFSGYPDMNTLTAILFVFMGIAVSFVGSKSELKKNILGFLSFAVAFFSGAVLLWYMGLVDALIDQEMFYGTLMNTANGMAVNTAFNFFIMSISLLLFSRGKISASLTQLFFTVAGFVALFAIIGYIYSSLFVITVASFLPMAIHTSLFFVFLSVSIYCILPEDGFMKIILSPYASGIFLRSLLPFVYLMPILIGWVVVQAMNKGQYDPQLNVALATVMTIVIFVAIIWRQSFVVDKFDRDREKTVVDVEKQNQELERSKKIMDSLLEDLESQKMKFERISQRLKLATQSAKIGVWEWDIPEDVIVWDNQMYKLYGVKKENFACTYEAWQECIHKEDRVQADGAIKFALKGDKNFDITFRVVWPDKSVHNIRAFGYVEHNKTGKPIKMIGVNWDITKEIAVDKEKTEFVSLASHQLKTPIGAINWDLEMLLAGDYGILTEKQKEVISGMYAMSFRMRELINSLLNVSRIDMGLLMIKPIPLDFVKLCEEVLMEMELYVSNKKHTLIKDYQQNLPLINADPTLMCIIFQNYLTNAIKYTGNQGRIVVSLKATDAEIIFSVSNNGEPIPEDEQPRIFQKMFRASNAEAQAPDGNGLGLYLVGKIMETSGGRAWFTSKKGEDTVFYASLPLSGMVPKEGTKELS